MCFHSSKIINIINGTWVIPFFYPIRRGPILAALIAALEVSMVTGRPFGHSFPCHLSIHRLRWTPSRLDAAWRSCGGYHMARAIGQRNPVRIGDDIVSPFETVQKQPK